MPGARPYGAVVVKDGKIVGEGLNQSAKKFDPTSHGEVEAVRDACRNLKTTDLSGCRALHLVRAVLGVRLRHDHGRHQPHVLRRIARRNPRAVMPRPTDAAAGRCWCASRSGLPADKREHVPAEEKLGDEAIAVLKAWVEKQK